MAIFNCLEALRFADLDAAGLKAVAEMERHVRRLSEAVDRIPFPDQTA
jgi:hypothetical protein